VLKEKKFLTVPYNRKREIWLLVILGITIFIFLCYKRFPPEYLTLLALLVALFNQRFQNWLDRPVVEVDFDRNSDRCYRTANLRNDIIQEFSEVITKERQYFKLKVSNKGRGIAKKVRIIIDLFREDMSEVERFEPNCLRWITGDKEIDIASGETTYVNLLSHVLGIYPLEDEKPVPNNFFVIRWEIYDFSARAIAWDRQRENYIIKLIIHGENVKAKTHWFKYIPDGKDIFKAGQLVKL